MKGTNGDSFLVTFKSDLSSGLPIFFVMSINAAYQLGQSTHVTVFRWDLMGEVRRLISRTALDRGNGTALSDDISDVLQQLIDL